MTRVPLEALLTLVLATAPAANGTERFGFVGMLGADTTDVERCAWSAQRLEVDQVSRTPRVVRRRMTFEYGARDALRSFSILEFAPDAASSAPPIRSFTGRCTEDSVFVEYGAGHDARRVRAAFRAGSPAIYAPAPWSQYDLAIARFASSRDERREQPLYRIGSGGAGWIRMTRLGRDSIAVLNHHDDAFLVVLDDRGRMREAVPTGGPSKFSASRVPDVDVEAHAARWMAAERTLGAMGSLSTRDTVTADVGGATLWVDYGRPARRGRVVFGGIVPFDVVWRTGANSATQLRTDRAIEIGGHVLAPGRYSLWTIPGREGWKLVVNADADAWGTQHDAAKDLFAVDVYASTLPEIVERFTISIEPAAEGGWLLLDWDTTRVSVPFRIAAAEPPRR